MDTLLWPALLLALGLRTTVVEAFEVPSGSMYPTILRGDRLFAYKLAYGIGRKSAPARGDVIVFASPEPDEAAAGVAFVKRAVALPGDVVTVEGGHLHLNGKAVPTCRVGSVGPTAADPDRTPGDVFVEFLDGWPNLVFIEQERESRREGPYTMSRGETFVLGDDRLNSHDSRTFFGGRGGGIRFSNIVGRATVLFLPVARFWTSLSGATLPEPAEPALKDALARCLAKGPASMLPASHR